MPSPGGKPKLSFPSPRPVRFYKSVHFIVYVLFLLFGFNAIPIQRISGLGFMDEWVINTLEKVTGVCDSVFGVLTFLSAPRDLTFTLLSDFTRFVIDSADANGLLVDQASVYLVVAASILILHTLLPAFAAHWFLWLLSWICGWVVSLFKGVLKFLSDLAGVSRPGSGPADINRDSPNSGLTPYLRKQINANYQQLRHRSSVALPNRSYLRVQRLDPSSKEPVTDEIKDWNIHNEIMLSESPGGPAILIKLESNGKSAYIPLSAGERQPLKYEEAFILEGGPQPYALTWFGGERP